MTKHIVCYSGGKSSALVACMVVERFGAENVVLLNHRVDAEPNDVERFENEVAKHLGLEITYANADTKYGGFTPIHVAKFEKAFSSGPQTILCTAKLKTIPFMAWLKENYADGDVIYYGFDKEETARIQRRSSILGSQGYKTDYPLAFWDNPLDVSHFEKIGIKPPMQYEVFKHGNCMCCWKAGKQSWYVYYVNARELYNEHAEMEQIIGHSIHRDWWLDEMAEEYEKWRLAGIPATEHIPTGTFFKMTRAIGSSECEVDDTKPCDCVF